MILPWALIVSLHLSVFLLASKHLQSQASQIKAGKSHMQCFWLLHASGLEDASGHPLYVSGVWYWSGNVLFGGVIHHLLVNHILPTAHQLSDYSAHSSHPNEQCCAKGRGGFPCGRAIKKKIIKQSQKKEFRSVTALGPCPFSMKVKKHLHIDWKAPYLQCTWDWQKCPDVPHKALLLVVSNLCVTSCMTNPKGDVHVRSMQAIWMCCLGWIHLLCSSATFLCWIWTLSFYRKIWIELNLHEPSQVCNY